MSVLELADVRRTYHLGKAVDVPALRGVSIVFEAGDFVTIVGPSGSGKTTLLNVAGLLDHADAGEIVVDGRATQDLSDSERTVVRRRKIGFVFQSFNLLPHLTAEENVGMPLRYADGQSGPMTPAELLDRVGLGERLGHRPDQLSGGEQQRVAIARALVCDPPLLLCDEPTGELDSETASGIHDLLADLRRSGKTLVVVTHNEELARIAGRSVHMRDGLITDDGKRRRASGGGGRRTQRDGRAWNATPVAATRGAATADGAKAPSTGRKAKGSTAKGRAPQKRAPKRPSGRGT
jgi:putative ABC transport system ATP-binding protein